MIGIKQSTGKPGMSREVMVSKEDPVVLGTSSWQSNVHLLFRRAKPGLSGGEINGMRNRNE